MPLARSGLEKVPGELFFWGEEVWTQLVPEASAPTEAEWFFFTLIVWRVGLCELQHVGSARTQWNVSWFTMVDERVCGLPSAPLTVPRASPCGYAQSSRITGLMHGFEVNLSCTFRGTTTLSRGVSCAGQTGTQKGPLESLTLCSPASRMEMIMEDFLADLAQRPLCCVVLGHSFKLFVVTLQVDKK